MSFMLKPKVAYPQLPQNALGLTRRDYEGANSTLCAGCGHDSITAALIEACWGLSLEPKNIAMGTGHFFRDKAGAGQKTLQGHLGCIAPMQRLGAQTGHLVAGIERGQASGFTVVQQRVFQRLGRNIEVQHTLCRLSGAGRSARP